MRHGPLRFGICLATFAYLCLGLVPSPAIASVSCPTNPLGVRFLTYYNPTVRITGVRAAIKLRKDGVVCNNDPVANADTGDWIALEPGDASEIIQIGFFHVWDSSINASEYCRFWAIGSGNPRPYGCGNQSDHQTVYFKVRTYSDFSGNVAEDCGAHSDYTGCTLEGSNSENWPGSWGMGAAEANDACATQIMGYPTDTAIIGTASGPMEFRKSVSDPWTQPTRQNDDPNYCNAYNPYNTSNGLQSWDDRNGQ